MPSNEPKLAPWQKTLSLQSDPTLSPSENFTRCLDLLEEAGLDVDRPHCRLLSSKSFSFNLSITISMVATVIRFVASPMALTLHWKTKRAQTDCVLLTQTVKGEAKFFDQGATFPLASGHFCLSSSEKSTNVTLTKAGEFIALVVSEDYFLTHSGIHSQLYFSRPFIGDTPLQRFFSRHLMAIVRDIVNLDARDVSDVCDGVFCLLRPVLMEADRRNPTLVASGHRSPDDWRAAVMEVMQHRYSKPGLTVTDIAKEVGVSGRYLSTLFRDIGSSVMETLMDLRLRRASVQLSEQHMLGHTVAEIAQKNGFRSSTHFCRLFKARYGMTPMQWRQSYAGS